MSANELSFQQLLKGFLYYSQQNGKEIFPSPFGYEWHIFLYDLAKETEQTHPEIKAALGNFSWDGPGPKNEQLDDFLSILLFINAIALNEDGNLYLTISIEVPPAQEKYEHIFSKMYEIAKTKMFYKSCC